MNEEELIRNINTYLRSKALYQHTIKKKLSCSSITKLVQESIADVRVDTYLHYFPKKILKEYLFQKNIYMGNEDLHVFELVNMIVTKRGEKKYYPYEDELLAHLMNK